MNLVERREFLQRMDYLNLYFDFLKNPQAYDIERFITVLISIHENPSVQDFMKDVPIIRSVGRPVFMHDTLEDYVKLAYKCFFSGDAVKVCENTTKLREAGLDLIEIKNYGRYFDLDTFYIFIPE